jgi:hypothetical protein
MSWSAQIVGGGRHAGLLTRQHDAEHPYAVHSPGGVGRNHASVSRVVGWGAAAPVATGRRSARCRRSRWLHIRRHRLLAAVAAVIEQVQPSLAISSVRRWSPTGRYTPAGSGAAVLDAERGEQPWEQKVAQV